SCGSVCTSVLPYLFISLSACVLVRAGREYIIRIDVERETTTESSRSAHLREWEHLYVLDGFFVALEVLQEDLNVPLVHVVVARQLERILVVASLAAHLNRRLHVEVQIWRLQWCERCVVGALVRTFMNLFSFSTSLSFV